VPAKARWTKGDKKRQQIGEDTALEEREKEREETHRERKTLATDLPLPRRRPR
jgi:hypothetical protein